MVKRIAGRAQNEQVEKWLESQVNLNQSLNNIISHLVRIFGYQDIMEYDIQEFLFTQILENEYIPNPRIGFESPNVNMLYVSKLEDERTNTLIEILHAEKDGFNVVISNDDSYNQDLNLLSSEGIALAEEMKLINSLGTKFIEQMAIAEKVSIEEKKILYINTNSNQNGFSIDHYREFINNLFERQNESSERIPIRIFLDGEKTLINWLPDAVVAVARARKMIFIGAVDSIDDLTFEIAANFHKENL